MVYLFYNIKKRVEFRLHNLLNTPFEKGFDLIICRNVVIYFSDESKRRLYQKFYNSLRDYGVLFTGGTETMITNFEPNFERLHTSFHQKNPEAVALERYH